MIEVAHWSALAPLIALIVFRCDAPAVYWMVALAFGVDWFVDAFAAATGGSWALDPYYPVVQLGLFAWALGGSRWGLIVVASTVLFLPSVWARVVGSALILWLAQRHPLAPALYLYVGLGTVLYLGMISDLSYEPFMRWWYPYQAVRLAAFGVFVGVVLKTVTGQLGLLHSARRR